MTTYHGYAIDNGPRGYRVREPGGTWWAEWAVTLDTAKRWIDCHRAERFAADARRARRKGGA